MAIDELNAFIERLRGRDDLSKEELLVLLAIRDKALNSLKDNDAPVTFHYFKRDVTEIVYKLRSLGEIEILPTLSGELMRARYRA